MKLLVVTVSNNETNPGFIHLLNSLKHFGYNYQILKPVADAWCKNFEQVAGWLKLNRAGYTHILYTDAWDTLAFGPCTEIERAFGTNPKGWILSGEKNPCFCGDTSKYNKGHRWPFICAGGYLADIDFFISVIDKYPRVNNENDQQWASRLFEIGVPEMYIDTNCSVFQTMYNFGQPSDGEFALSDHYRLVNLITVTRPVFVHGNGKVDMRWLYHPRPFALLNAKQP